MTYRTSTILDGKAAIIEIPPRLDAHISQELKSIIIDYVNSNTFFLIMDFQHTEFIDSSGLGALVSQISKCKSNNGDVMLASPKTKIIEILQITNLDKVLRCFDSIDEAIQHINI